MGSNRVVDVGGGCQALPSTGKSWKLTILAAADRHRRVYDGRSHGCRLPARGTRSRARAGCGAMRRARFFAGGEPAAELTECSI